MGATQPLDKLTPAELERLTLLAKQMGVAMQSIREVLLHGYESSNPLSEDTATHRQKLQEALGGVRHAANRLCDAGDLSAASIHDWTGIKAVSLQRELRHQDAAMSDK